MRCKKHIKKKNWDSTSGQYRVTDIIYLLLTEKIIRNNSF